MNETWVCPMCNITVNNRIVCPKCGIPNPTVTLFSGYAPSSGIDFYRITYSDGSETIYDKVNNYRIEYTKEEGYNAYNENGMHIYNIRDDYTCIYTPQEKSLRLENGMDIYDFRPDMNINDPNYDIFFKDGNVIQVNNHYEDGDVENHYNLDGSGYSVDKSDDSIKYFKSDGKVYQEVDGDGSIYFDGNCLNPDGTYECSTLSGTYTLDSKGNYVLKDQNGNEIYYDQYCQPYKRIDNKGNIYTIDNVLKSQAIVKNGKTIYSGINHIEYDEEAYNTILNTLNDIDINNVNNAYLNIKNTVNSFPDAYPIESISNSDIIKHFDLITTLGKMTNYSLLAYQVCDEGLKDGLYLLIDSLFGDKESSIANGFKNKIQSFIEDNDHDNILEYKKGTDFERISSEAIVSEIYHDNKGNKWYLNSRGNIIGVDGNNPKITFGGEEFTVECNKDGVIILKDSKGASLNIFGDYNVDSLQFGGNQSDVLDASWDRPYIDDILSKYFPNVTMEEKESLLQEIARTGCGYTGLADIVFKKFEGREEEFYKTFGYPMYEVNIDDEEFIVDYNYEPLIVNLGIEAYDDSQNKVWDTIVSTDGTGPDELRKMVKYLDDNYNVRLDELPKGIEYIVDDGYNLYSMDGELVYGDVPSHVIVGVGENENGQRIVSTWGEKLIYEPSVSDSMYNEYKEVWDTLTIYD